jgi:hypothetical protein
MVSTRRRRPTPVQTDKVDLQHSVPANVVTPDHGTDATLVSSNGTGACNISVPRFLELHLEALLTSSMIAVAQAFDHWMNQANFIALIETLGGPLTEMNDSKVIAIDLSKALLKAMGRVSYAGQLNYGYNDENIIANLNKNVYYYQMKYKGNRLNFYYVSSRANITKDVELPAGETAKELASQKVLSFLKDDIPNLRNWWLSKNAKQLFKPYKDEDGAIKAVENIVHVLSGALKKGNDFYCWSKALLTPKKDN